MSDTCLSLWQKAFFERRVCTRSSGNDGVYFREQVFGALDVLSDALPDLVVALGEQNFRFFVREFLEGDQPRDAMGFTMIAPFLEFLRHRPELSSHPVVVQLIRQTLESLKARSAR